MYKITGHRDSEVSIYPLEISSLAAARARHAWVGGDILALGTELSESVPRCCRGPGEGADGGDSSSSAQPNNTQLFRLANKALQPILEIRSILVFHGFSLNCRATD